MILIIEEVWVRKKFGFILWGNGWQGKIEGKLKIQKFEYLENEKRFLDEIKSIFQNYLRAVKKLISSDKNKKERAQALNSFLIKVFCNLIICNVTMPP